MVLTLTEQTFEKEINGSIPIVVDFWAEWCGPCKRLGPTFEALAPTYEGKLKFGKLNVEQNQTLGPKYSVMAIPCMILFKNGKEVSRIVGALPPDSLKKKIDEMLVMAK